MLIGLVVLFGLVSFICDIIIVIEAFKDDAWKGLVCLFCGVYLLYYMLVELKHEKRGLLLFGSLGCGLIALILQAWFVPAASMQ
ncbi:MAG TPA: hypothetical protein EYM79_04315 [Planctomycetes bacterium]|nr:hypothetical protein [Planctomycetota bacterium]